MVKNRIIVIICNLPWEWTADYINQTALALARRNCVICYMAPGARSLKERLFEQRQSPLLRALKKNLYIYTPVHFIPFRRLALVERFNDRLNVWIVRSIITYMCFTRSLTKKILWIFDPRFEHISMLFPGNYFFVYDMVDYVRRATFNSLVRDEIIRKEQHLFVRADVIVTVSDSLKKLFQKDRPDIQNVSQGFRRNFIKKNPSNFFLNIPVKKPVIGFVGAINYRLDFALLHGLISQRPQWHFVFVGSIQYHPELPKKSLDTQWRDLRKRVNVFYYPQQDKTKMPGIISQFDIGMIPYDIGLDFNRFCYPMKLFEYFSMGKPVIATPIHALRSLRRFVKIGRSVEEWEMHIAHMLSRPWPKHKQIAQRAFALSHSWEKRTENVLQYVEKKEHETGRSV